MKLFVDADSCPRRLRAIILKAVEKRSVEALFVADRVLNDVVAAQKAGLVEMAVVPPGEDSADDFLVEKAYNGSIAITRDIPLANRLTKKGVTVLDDRGGVFTAANIGERLSMRNLMGDLREAGLFAEQTKPLGHKEIQLFANALDRELTQKLK
ncbi:MAG: DUF188 domain-containing protein [Sphaerochaetaceae bacterium]|jgi:uncharacterized protein YaiI (UPF0178 family)